MPGTGVKAAQAEATRQALITAGRAAFARDGYAGAIADEIVASAGVTRGALYHHFGGKRGLFVAVVEDVEREMFERIASVTPRSTDPWETFRAACQVFLDCCLDPATRRIAILDGPAVLTEEEWEPINERYTRAELRRAIGAAARTRRFLKPHVVAMADLLKGALHEAGHAVAIADHPEVARREQGAAIDLLLTALGGRPD